MLKRKPLSLDLLHENDAAATPGLIIAWMYFYSSPTIALHVYSFVYGSYLYIYLLWVERKDTKAHRSWQHVCVCCACVCVWLLRIILEGKMDSNTKCLARAKRCSASMCSCSCTQMAWWFWQQSGDNEGTDANKLDDIGLMLLLFMFLFFLLVVERSQLLNTNTLNQHWIRCAKTFSVSRNDTLICYCCSLFFALFHTPLLHSTRLALASAIIYIFFFCFCSVLSEIAEW